MNKKVLVLYVLSEYNHLVKNFFENCIFEDDNVDFLIICNGITSINNFNLPSYVKILYRENNGYDFGGWSDGLLRNDLYKNYDYFIMANSTIYGPYLPSYYKGKWTDILLNGLNEDVKLFGVTINVWCIDNINIKAHVQSYLFSMDKTTLEYLISKKIFTLDHFINDKNTVVDYKEIEMSRLILENNWNIGCLCQYYKDADFRLSNNELLQKFNGLYLSDIMYKRFENVYWNKYEIVFIKGNRFIL